MPSEPSQPASIDSTGWEQNRGSLPTLDVLTSTVPHLLLCAPPSSSTLARLFGRTEIRRCGDHHSDDTGMEGEEHTSPRVCVCSFQQAPGEQSMVIPCINDRDCEDLHRVMSAAFADEQEREEKEVPRDQWQLSGPWRAMRVRGPLEHHLIGVMQSLTTSLVKNECFVFALSFWDADYLLIKREQYNRAVHGLKRDSWVVI